MLHNSAFLVPVERAVGRNLVSFDYSFLAIAFPSWMSIAFVITVTDYLERGWVEVIDIYLVILNIIWPVVLICRTQRQGLKQRE